MNKRARFTADEAAALRRKFWDNAKFKVLEQAAHAIRTGAPVEEGDREFVALVLEDRANREWRRVNSMSGVRISAYVADYLTRCKRGVSLPEAARWALEPYEGFEKADVAAVVKATQRLRKLRIQKQGQAKR
jgi:hypothetical protein